MRHLDQPVVYIIACGAPPAADLPDFVEQLSAEGWRPGVLATPMARRWLDVERLERLTGWPVRSEYRRPDEPKSYPPPDAVVVAPATLNTINKLAAGITDTYVLGVLAKALSRSGPLIVAPWVNSLLAAHPLLEPSLHRLRSWGVEVLYDQGAVPAAGTGPSSATAFPWEELRALLTRRHS